MFGILSFLLIFELGWYPVGHVLMYSSDATNEYVWQESMMSNIFYVKAGGELIVYDVFYINGTMEVPVYPTDNVFNWSPTALFSGFETGFRFPPVILFLKHHCNHPVVPYLPKRTYTFNFESAYTQIGIRIELKLDDN